MYLEVKEEFNLPIGDIYPYFESPIAWTKLYGLVKKPKTLKNGWYAIPLHRFPFPLVAKVVENEPDKKVRWIFGRFWRGVGEVRFSRRNEMTIVEGYEYIVPHGLCVPHPVPRTQAFNSCRSMNPVCAAGFSRLAQGSAPTLPDKPLTAVELDRAGNCLPGFLGW